jgi:hypothetical protein
MHRVESAVSMVFVEKSRKTARKPVSGGSTEQHKAKVVWQLMSCNRSRKDACQTRKVCAVRVG